MRRIILALVLAVSVTLAAPPEQPGPSPLDQVRLAIAFIRGGLRDGTIKREDQCHLQFFSLNGLPPELVEKIQRIGQFEINSDSRGEKPILAREVPGSNGLLWWGLIDDWGWNRGAANAVGDRDPFFREPWIPTADADTLRNLVGVKPGKDGQLRVIWRLDWLIYEAGDTTRTPTYYDLLYAEERFPWVKYSDGWWRRKFRDFPASEDDFNFAFGAKELLAVIQDKKRRLAVDKGSIVDEGDSIVAYHNRLLVWVQIAQGTWRKTFDFKDSVGPNNLPEEINRAANYHALKPDASEYIVNLANGGQAYLLAVQQGKKRAEFADPVSIARDTSAGRQPVVITKRSCTICHALGSQIPSNILEDGQKAGVDLAQRTREQKRRVEAFLLDSSLGRIIKADRQRYADFVRATSGYDPEKNAALYKESIDWYERKLGPEQMARECGVTVERFKDAVRVLGRFRLDAAVKDKAWMPRDVWDREEYQRVMTELYAPKKGKKR